MFATLNRLNARHPVASVALPILAVFYVAILATYTMPTLLATGTFFLTFAGVRVYESARQIDSAAPMTRDDVILALGTAYDTVLAVASVWTHATSIPVAVPVPVAVAVESAPLALLVPYSVYHTSTQTTNDDDCLSASVIVRDEETAVSLDMVIRAALKPILEAMAIEMADSDVVILASVGKASKSRKAIESVAMAACDVVRREDSVSHKSADSTATETVLSVEQVPTVAPETAVELVITESAIVTNARKAVQDGNATQTQRAIDIVSGPEGESSNRMLASLYNISESTFRKARKMIAQ